MRGNGYVESGQVIEIVMNGSLETKPCTSDKHSTHFRPTLTVVTEVHFFVDIGRRQIEIMPWIDFTLIIPLRDFGLDD